MPKPAKAKLDQAGLTKLGLEKLVEILLDEAAFNKALKSRLQAALAGNAGAAEVARLIDAKLDSLQKSRAYLSPTRANTLSVELRGLLKNITSELADLDRHAAFERVLRFLTVGAVIEERARKGGARLAKVLEDARDSLVQSALGLESEEQVRVVPLLEALRIADDDGRFRAALLDILCGMHKPAADAWKSILTGKLKSPTEKAARWLNSEPVAYLQRLASHNADIDAYVELELLKPQERRDSLLIARMLHEAKRYAEALEWVRKPAATTRVMQWDGGVAGTGQSMQPPRLLEADILDALKQKADAQKIRWEEFERTLRPDILRNISPNSTISQSSRRPTGPSRLPPAAPASMRRWISSWRGLVSTWRQSMCCAISANGMVGGMKALSPQPMRCRKTILSRRPCSTGYCSTTSSVAG